MKMIEQIYKFYVVTLYLFKQYLNVFISPGNSKKFFTEMYIRAIENNKYTLPFKKGLSRKRLEELFPGILMTNISTYAQYESLFHGTYNKENHYLVSTKELFTLTALVKYLNPSIFFEFGSYKGWTVSNLIQNIPLASQIYTLDILERESGDSKIDEILERKNVHRLSGDSLKFDFSPYFGKIDFIFIDACHSESAVRKDTENALKMLSKTGVIVWHDFNPEHLGVFNFLHELSKELSIYSIKNTALAVYIKN
ncbi:MAG: class I SAM-dependent methyltransferase [Bacteriovorax sp.]|nr:class I SAM-dependent methyltransferase [Bacteriovorax sp.]